MKGKGLGRCCACADRKVRVRGEEERGCLDAGREKNDGARMADKREMQVAHFVRDDTSRSREAGGASVGET
jgi:hypothetical protein